MLTRMLFWYFGHPLVYFWIMGAYMIWYNVIPTRYGATSSATALTRLTFIMLLAALDAGRHSPPVHGSGHLARLGSGCTRC